MVADVRLGAGGAEAGAAVPVSLGVVDLVVGGVRGLVEGHVVEDVELRLGAEVDGVGNTALEQMALGLLRHVARVARIGLARDRVDHVADQRQRSRRVEGVDLRRRGIRHQQHVRLGDLLEAADRGAVEAEPIAEGVLVQAADRERHVLPCARHVGELDVDHLHPELLGHREHVGGARVALTGELLDRQRLIAGDEFLDCNLLGCRWHGRVDSSLARWAGDSRASGRLSQPGNRIGARPGRAQGAGRNRSGNRPSGA